MPERNSIERQVTRTFVGLTLLLTTVYVGMVVLFAYITEDALVEKLLAREISYLQDTYAGTGQWPSPRLDYMMLYASAEQAPVPVRRKLQASPDSGEIFTADERHYHVRNFYLDEDLQALLVAEVSSLLVVTNLSGSLLKILAGLVVITLAVSLWLAYRVARRTTRPIIQLSDEVKQMHQQGKALDLSAAGRNDEIGYLAETIQSNFNQIHDALEREGHFTRDVSHELRTPLTVMKNTLTLLETRPPQPRDIEQLKLAAQHVQRTVAILLALARQDSVQAQSLRLRPIVEEAILGLHGALERSNFSVEVAIADDCELIGNRQLITLLVGNLVENAMRYAAEPSLNISLHEDSLVFSNAVFAPVIDDPVKPGRKQADSPGLGQGLFLVERIAARLNWLLSTRSQAGIFSIILKISP
ncbi:sensor histidine kinase [Haliea sp.]